MNDSGSFSNSAMMSALIDNNNVLFHYEGAMEHRTIDVILKNAIKALDNSGIEKYLQKRAFRIMMESLENIQKHSDNASGGHSYSEFSLMKNKKELIFKTSNAILNTDKKEIQAKIEEINRASGQTLKQMQEIKLTTGELTPKGGSGIGLINIAIRSNNKLDYKFETIDTKTSHFILQIKINI